MGGSGQAQNIDRRVGNRIALQRRGRGLSLAELAAAVGVDTIALGRIERGDLRVSAGLLFRLCIALDCQMVDLLR